MSDNIATYLHSWPDIRCPHKPASGFNCDEWVHYNSVNNIETGLSGKKTLSLSPPAGYLQYGHFVSQLALLFCWEPQLVNHLHSYIPTTFPMFPCEMKGMIEIFICSSRFTFLDATIDSWCLAKHNSIIQICLKI